jgi:hypothetical protein
MFAQTIQSIIWVQTLNQVAKRFSLIGCPCAETTHGPGLEHDHESISASSESRRGIKYRRSRNLPMVILRSILATVLAPEANQIFVGHTREPRIAARVSGARCTISS